MKRKSGKGVRNLETERQFLSMVIRKGLTQKMAYEQMLEGSEEAKYSDVRVAGRWERVWSILGIAGRAGWLRGLNKGSVGGDEVGMIRDVFSNTPIWYLFTI